jgi:hypothetical protein
MMERAEAWHLTCPLSGAQFLVQFWDMHEEDRRGSRHMAWAVFQQHSMFPTNYRLFRHGRHFYPAPQISCDGERAAKELMGFLQYDGVLGDDIIADELEVIHAEAIGEHSLSLGG